MHKKPIAGAWRLVSYGVLLLLPPTLTLCPTTASRSDPRREREASSRLADPVRPAPPMAAQSPEACPQNLWTRTELFFGSAKPDGSTVTEQEFRHFLDQEVTTRFPDGLTLLVGRGQFRHASGVVVQERSMLLVLLYSSGEPDNTRGIEAIREAYKRRFRQESVLRLDACALVSF